MGNLNYSSIDMAVYITAVSGGNCVTRHNNQILNKTPKKDQNQLWTLEHKEGSETQVAIKSNVDGKYLRAKAGNAYGAVEVGGRQWWELEAGHDHGAYWMKSLDFPNAYLCNANGSYIDDNKIYMWPKQANWTHALNFYLQDPKAAGFSSQEAGEDASVEVARLREELKAKEATMAKKDAELAKTKDELTKASQGSGDMSAKLKALEEQSEHLSASVKEHEAREAELVTRLKAQEAAANKKSPSSSSKDQSALKNQQAEMSKKLAAVEAREKAVAQREK